MNRLRISSAAMLSLVACLAARPASADALGDKYGKMLDELKSQLTAELPKAKPSADAVDKLLASDALDAKLVRFVVLNSATPAGLADFASQGKAQGAMIDKLLSDTALMQQMLIADGAARPRQGRDLGPAQFGRAMQIYTDIQKASPKASSGVLQRLAVAIALEHAVPIKQVNPGADKDAPETVDPVKRYQHYEKAYLNGELDPMFDQLTAWDLRFVVDGEEPDWTLEWGRTMLRNFRPDHIIDTGYGWRYVAAVKTDVKYGSGDVKYDRPELQNYQNIIMNGGVCGRRAFFGRFILRAFGVPTTARPQSGHAALLHRTPDGWVPNLGGPWGAGWTKTIYDRDKNFLATTQARAGGDEYLKVKRAQWIGDVMGETPVYGEESKQTPGFWYGTSLRVQREIIEKTKAKTLEALGTDLGESNEPTVAEKIKQSPVTAADKQISVGSDGTITIPAAAYSSPKGNTGDVIAMKSFAGGMQVALPRFFPKGLTILRGGAWRGGAESCASGARLQSGGYGQYNNWGMRAAMTPTDANPPKEITLQLGNGVTMEMVYIKPGTFTMGGESTKDGKFDCVELPKHQVTLTKGFYLGKHEVTQAQFQAIMGSNPSKASKDPNCPADTVSLGNALEFCDKASEVTGQEVRLPTEAEWEYAARAGTSTKYFFGDDASKLGDYAWFNENDGGKSHPVGQKKPNPWGLYDIYGNVCERVSDTYAKDYYAKGPKQDPTGPRQGAASKMEYQVQVPKAGKYQLTANVVTVNYEQQLSVTVDNAETPVLINLPFTNGQWMETKPVTVTLKSGANTLKFFRDNPPQYGMAVKSFTLKPVR